MSHQVRFCVDFVYTPIGLESSDLLGEWFHTRDVYGL